MPSTHNAPTPMASMPMHSQTGGKTGMHRQAVAPANKASADAMPASGTGRIHAGMHHADIHILM